MKFAKLIEYNMNTIFLQKAYTKHAGEASLKSLYKKSELKKSSPIVSLLV